MSVYKAQGDGAVPFIEITVFYAHIDHGRKTAAEARRETARIEVGIVDNVCIERREHADEVADLVHGDLVQQEQVVRSVAAANIQAGREFRAARDTGHHLQGLDQVRGSQNSEVAADLRAVYSLKAGLGNYLSDGLFVPDDSGVEGVDRDHRQAIQP